VSQFMIGDFHDIAGSRYLHANLIVGGVVVLVQCDSRISGLPGFADASATGVLM